MKALEVGSNMTATIKPPDGITTGIQVETIKISNSLNLLKNSEIAFKSFWIEKKQMS
jgi:hypothetical protein